MIGKFMKSEIDTFFPLVKKKNVSILSYINTIFSVIINYHSNSIKYIYHAIKSRYLDFFSYKTFTSWYDLVSVYSILILDKNLLCHYKRCIRCKDLVLITIPYLSITK